MITVVTVMTMITMMTVTVMLFVTLVVGDTCGQNGLGSVGGLELLVLEAFVVTVVAFVVLVVMVEAFVRRCERLEEDGCDVCGADRIDSLGGTVVSEVLGVVRVQVLMILHKVVIFAGSTDMTTITVCRQI